MVFLPVYAPGRRRRRDRPPTAPAALTPRGQETQGKRGKEPVPTPACADKKPKGITRIKGERAPPANGAGPARRGLDVPGMAANNRGIIQNGNVLGRDGKNLSGFFTWKLGNHSQGQNGRIWGTSSELELKSSQISARRTFSIHYDSTPPERQNINVA